MTRDGTADTQARHGSSLPLDEPALVARAETARTNGSAGRSSRSAERAPLDDAALAHQHDVVGEIRRLVHVVGDQHDRLAERGEDALQLFLQLVARDRIERSQRLVEQQQRRIEHQRAHDASRAGAARRKDRVGYRCSAGRGQLREVRQLGEPGRNP